MENFAVGSDGDATGSLKENEENLCVAPLHDAKHERKVEEEKKQKRKELARRLLQEEKLLAACALSPVSLLTKSQLNADKENNRNDGSTTEQARSNRSSPRLNKCSALRVRSAEMLITKLDQEERSRNGMDGQAREMSIGWTIDDQGRHMPIPDWHEKKMQRDKPRGVEPREYKQKSPSCKPNDYECSISAKCQINAQPCPDHKKEKRQTSLTCSRATAQHASPMYHDFHQKEDQLDLTPSNRILTIEDLTESQYVTSSRFQKPKHNNLSDKQVLEEVNRKADAVQWRMKVVEPPGPWLAFGRQKYILEFTCANTCAGASN
eukprot:746901-Hanusia_phi.AAC.5